MPHNTRGARHQWRSQSYPNLTQRAETELLLPSSPANCQAAAIDPQQIPQSSGFVRYELGLYPTCTSPRDRLFMDSCPVPVIRIWSSRLKAPTPFM
jgi:hypothetical protein